MLRKAGTDITLNAALERSLITAPKINSTLIPEVFSICMQQRFRPSELKKKHKKLDILGKKKQTK